MQNQRSAFLALLLLPATMPAQAPSFDNAVTPFLKTYCLGCHNATKKKGDVDLSKLDIESRAVGRLRLLEQSLVRIKNGEMPPEGSKQPTSQEKERLEAWLTVARKKAADCQQLATDQTQNFYRGHVMSRRLTRLEYNNTIRDLLGVGVIAFGTADTFPSDGSGGEGFDTVGDALFSSAIHVERYLDAAERVLALVLENGTGSERFPADALKAARAKLLGAGRDRAAARATLAEFMPRAFRRPVRDAEIERFLQQFDRGTQRGDSYVKALKLALKAVLISPHFLFLIEPEPEKEGVTPLADFPLASRLSYFLWSTMPDEELFRLADAGKLRETETLRGQVKRMLRDPRTRGLAEGFAIQWLGLRPLGATTRPDPERFPEFTDALASSMRDEVITFVENLFREDRSLLELIDSDYTYANENLAKLYGLPGVSGPQMRKVPLPDRSRGGVVGMAAVLTVTSYPLRTSPVLRGKWVLEDLLGAKVPPPPPNAGELPPDDRTQQNRTLREQLELHRKKAECASCHARMDPLGFGLENFDAIGRYRTTQAGKPIDARGELPGGDRFDGPKELKQVLLKRKGEFLRNLTRKMLGFALGRQLYPFENCVVDDTMKSLEGEAYHASVLVERIVLSYPFRHRYVKK